MSITNAAIAIDILEDQFAGQVRLRRRVGGQYVDGRWTEGIAPQDLPIRGVIYHMSSEEQMNLPENLKRDDNRYYWTRRELRIQTRDEQEDQLVYQGKVFDVLKVWERFEGSYHKVMIGRNHVRTNTI